jgi:hypothetical protein
MGKGPSMMQSTSVRKKLDHERDPLLIRGHMLIKVERVK